MDLLHQLDNKKWIASPHFTIFRHVGLYDAWRRNGENSRLQLQAEHFESQTSVRFRGTPIFFFLIFLLLQSLGRNVLRDSLSSP